MDIVEPKKVTLVVRTVHNWYGHEMSKVRAEWARSEFLSGKKRMTVDETAYNTDHVLSVEVLDNL